MALPSLGLCVVSSQAAGEDRARQSAHRRSPCESCMRHIAPLPPCHWVEPRHAVPLSSCQRKSELGSSGKNRLYSGTVVIEKRDMGMELGSTPNIAGQVGVYVKGQGGVIDRKFLRGNIWGNGSSG